MGIDVHVNKFNILASSCSGNYKVSLGGALVKSDVISELIKMPGSFTLVVCNFCMKPAEFLLQ